MVLLLLVTFAFTFPVLVVGYIDRLWLALIIDIIGVQSYFALNEVARDLEDPFVFEPNDLPMAFIQVRPVCMASCLVALLLASKIYTGLENVKLACKRGYSLEHFL